METFWYLERLVTIESDVSIPYSGADLGSFINTSILGNTLKFS